MVIFLAAASPDSRAAIGFEPWKSYRQPAVETLVCKGALHLGDRQRHKDEYNAAAEHVGRRGAPPERAGEGAPASDGDGGSGGAKPPGL